MRVVLCALLLSSPALAVPHHDARRSNIILNSSQQRLDSSRFLTVFDAKPTELWRWNFGLGLTHAQGLLADRSDEQERVLIASRTEVMAGWSLQLPWRLAVGGTLPYLLAQEGIYPGIAMGPLPSSSLMDTRLWARVGSGLLPAPLYGAALVTLDVPTGDDQAFSSRGAFAGGLDALVSWHGDTLQVSGQLGYRIEPQRTLYTAVFDDHMRLAAALRFAPQDVDWALQSEVNLQVGGAPAVAFGAQAGFELRVGAVRVPVSGLVPLSSRPGQPTWAAAAGLITSYKRPPDLDGDGVRGDADKCPADPEDKDGFEDEDGCPDPDNDQDGVLDSKDECPVQSEDKDGFEDADGCPDDDNDQDGIPDRLDDCADQAEDKDGHLDLDGCPDPDEDQDGVEDDDDRCPVEPEDFDGFEDEDGCPDKDNDRDTVLDVDDQCPLVPENINDIDDEDGCPEPDADFDGILDPDDQCPKVKEDLDKWEDTDGCPEPDNDKDGLLDADDDCPNEPETINGIDDEDGCPEKAVLQRKRLKPHRIKARIHFRKHHWAIAKRSENTIGLIAQLIKDHPEILKLRIEGHTDQSGRRRANFRLSQKRADQVREALIELGVRPDILEAKGYGWSRPIDRRKGRRARRRNRRVGFLVLDVTSGKATVQEALDAAQP